MEITVYIEREQRNQTVTLAKQATAKDVLKKLALNPETVLIVKEGTVILPEASLKDKDNLKLLSVISGG